MTGEPDGPFHAEAERHPRPGLRFVTTLTKRSPGNACKFNWPSPSDFFSTQSHGGRPRLGRCGGRGGAMGVELVLRGFAGVLDGSLPRPPV